MTFVRENLPDTRSYFEAEGMPLKGPRSAKWLTTACNLHGSTDSMRVNVASGGWCCMSCGVKGGDVLAYHMQAHGLDFIDAAKALGAWVDDGKSPARPYKPSPLSPRQALGVLAFESTLIAVAGGNLGHGVTLTKTDLARVFKAAGRINSIREVFQ